MLEESEVRDVLFVFAHQDDEVSAATRIAWEAKRGNRVWCVYLTDGASNTKAEIRDEESLRALAILGVRSCRVAFLNDDHGRVPDGHLMHELSRAIALLKGFIENRNLDVATAYCPDWEGGHADHDAAHLATMAMVGAQTIVLSFSMYNAWRRSFGLFRVSSFVPPRGNLITRRLTFGERMLAAKMPWRYPSQLRTWLGLGPGFAARALFFGKEVLRPESRYRVLSRPHKGTLLYESLFGQSASELFRLSSEYRTIIAGGKHD
jgi:LmbE family N-acetylglucosaminyl deacetylase